MLAAVGPPALRVTVDLSFGSVMLPREHRSLLSQLLRVYGNNRNHATPVNLHFSGLRDTPPECLPPSQYLQAWEAERRSPCF